MGLVPHVHTPAVSGHPATGNGFAIAGAPVVILVRDSSVVVVVVAIAARGIVGGYVRR